jgi:hypothetical protein
MDFKEAFAVKPTDFPDQNALSAFFALRNVLKGLRATRRVFHANRCFLHVLDILCRK